MPEGGVAHFDAQIAQDALSQLRQGEVLLFANPGSQAPVVAFQATAPVTAPLLRFYCSGALVLPPVPLNTAPRDPKQPGYFLSAVPILSGCNDPLSQIMTIGSHPSLYHILRQIK